MNAPLRKPCAHVAEAGRIAEMVLRHQSNFSARHVRIAKSIKFNVRHENFAAIRTTEEITGALLEMHDALQEMRLL